MGYTEVDDLLEIHRCAKTQSAAYNPVEIRLNSPEILKGHVRVRDGSSMRPRSPPASVADGHLRHDDKSRAW